MAGKGELAQVCGEGDVIVVRGHRGGEPERIDVIGVRGLNSNAFFRDKDERIKEKRWWEGKR